LYHAVPPAHAFMLVLASFLLMMFALIVCGAAGTPVLVAIAIAEVSLLACPLAYVRAHGRDFRMIGLRRPRARFVIAAALVGISLWYANVAVVMWLFPPDAGTSIHETVVSGPAWPTLLVMAVAAPVCEEILFRGVLARGLASRLPTIVAMMASAAAFSGYHLSLVQAFPTFTLGLALAYIAVRADSVVPTIVAHALNNGIVVAISRLVPAEPHADSSAASVSVIATAGIALAITCGGLVIAARGDA
jgi:membrane protease YdiL (CAAX protease family)